MDALWLALMHLATEAPKWRQQEAPAGATRAGEEPRSDFATAGFTPAVEALLEFYFGDARPRDTLVNERQLAWMLQSKYRRIPSAEQRARGAEGHTNATRNSGQPGRRPEHPKLRRLVGERSVHGRSAGSGSRTLPLPVSEGQQIPSRAKLRRPSLRLISFQQQRPGRSNMVSGNARGHRTSTLTRAGSDSGGAGSPRGKPGTGSLLTRH